MPLHCEDCGVNISENKKLFWKTVRVPGDAVEKIVCNKCYDQKYSKERSPEWHKDIQAEKRRMFMEDQRRTGFGITPNRNGERVYAHDHKGDVKRHETPDERIIIRPIKTIF